MLARGNPERIIRNLSSVRATTTEWAQGGNPDDEEFVIKVNNCIDGLAAEINTVPRLRGLAADLINAASAN
jgi:hypothetical protein